MIEIKAKDLLKSDYQILGEQHIKLQQEIQKLNDSINQSNLAKISALLKLEKLQQEKEELIKNIKININEITFDGFYGENITKFKNKIFEMLDELKESDKNV